MFKFKKNGRDKGRDIVSDLEVRLQELMWRTLETLKPALAQDNSRRIIAYVAEPLAEGPHALRAQQLMSQADVHNPLPIPRRVLCSSFLLGLHLPLLETVQAGAFCPHCRPANAVLASHLLLHQQRTWEIAYQLVDCLCPGDDDQAATVRERLQTLWQQLYDAPRACCNENEVEDAGEPAEVEA